MSQLTTLQGFRTCAPGRAARFLPAFAAAMLLALPGCGGDRPKTVPVSGMVLLDGQPLMAKGTVRIVPRDARPATGEIDPATGRFTLTTFDKDDGCVPGAHAATVTARETLDNTQIRWLAPEKYSQPETSGLTVTVGGPTTDLKIELTSDGAKPAVQRTDSTGDSDPSKLH